MKSKVGEVPFQLARRSRVTASPLVIFQVASRLFRPFLFMGIVHEIGMRLSLFVSSLFHYLPCPPRAAFSVPPLSRMHTSAGSYPRNRHEWPFYSSKGMRPPTPAPPPLHIIQGIVMLARMPPRPPRCREGGERASEGGSGRGDRRHEGAILSFRVH